MSSIYRDKGEYAISTWTMDRYPLREALRKIDRAGFKTVEIWADNVHLDPRIAPDVGEAKRELARLGQNVHSVHAPFRWFHPRPETEQAFRDYRMALFRQTIDTCSEICCPILVVHALDRVEYNSRADEVDSLRDGLVALCEYGRARGVQIALENIADGNDPEEFHCTLRNQAACFQGFGLKFCLDIGHVPLSRADLYDEVAAAGSQLVTFHIHNNDLVADSHNLPNDGLIDWPALHDHVRKMGYKGQFVMEVLGRGDQIEVIDQIAALFEPQG